MQDVTQGALVSLTILVEVAVCCAELRVKVHVGILTSATLPAAAEIRDRSTSQAITSFLVN